MTGFLVKQGALAVAMAVAAGTVLATLLLGPSSGLAAALGGILIGSNFLALTWGMGTLLDSRTAGGRKVQIGVLLGLKLIIVASLLWWVWKNLALSELGLVIGMGSAVLGFTFGLNFASSSRAGQAAIKAEEERIRSETESED